MELKRTILILLLAVIVTGVLVGCSDNNIESEYFKDVKWDGEVVKFTVVKEVNISGVSINH